TGCACDVVTGREVRPVSLRDPTGAPSFTRLAVSPDGSRIATAHADQTVRLWEAQTGRPSGLLRGHAGEVRGGAFSPDGGGLISAGSDATARVWDPDAPQEAVLCHARDESLGLALSTLAFSPDGRRLATCCRGKILISDTGSGQEVGRVETEGHGSPRKVDFCPDGLHVV